LNLKKPPKTELLEKAIDRNVIIYLKTGSGKTYIAVMLIKHFAEEIDCEFSKGGKRTIFLCNNVPLVEQQAEYIRNHTNLGVGEYYGEKLINGNKLDSWSKETWDSELEKNHILVMSSQILVDITNHSFLGIQDIISYYL
jgi:endoribonuclease Dicer